MARYICLLALVLMLILAGGCGYDAAAAAGTTQPAATVTGTAPDQTADFTLSSDSPQTSASPAASAQDTAQATLAPAASPSPSPAAPPASPQAAASTAFIQAEPVTGTADVANYLPLRSSPSNTSEILKKIPQDGSFTVIQVASNTSWLKVSYTGETGYVLAQYTKIGGSSANRVCTVLSPGLNVRSGAGTKYDVLGILESGATVIVSGQAKASSYTWYEVLIGNETGYVYAKDCRISAS